MPRSDELSPGPRFAGALEQIGGLYAAFAKFLSWRADLLPAEYLLPLRRVRFRAPTIPRADFARVLTGFGRPGQTLIQNLGAEACWNTLARCAYRTSFEGRPLVVQLGRDPVPDRAFHEFERGVRSLAEGAARPAAAQEVLAAFRQWMQLADSPARERSYLDALAAARGNTLVEYPVIVPEFSNATVLCWEWVEGEPASSLLAGGAPEILDKVAECLLEQVCLLSVVEGEPDLDAFVLTKEGRLAVRRTCRLLAIPPALVRTVLEYISAVLSSDSAMAAHFLIRLTGGPAPLDLESRLLEGLSSLEPELKVNLRFPASAGAFESNWRALAKAGIARPLFLDCLHRNLVALGYWEAGITPSGQPRDAIAEAQWPVVGRLLRTRLGELLNREVASSWFIGSALLLFDGMRQMNRLAAEFRDNDLSLAVDTDGDSRETVDQANRTVRSGVIGGLFLILFLVCLRWGVSAPAPLSTGLAVMAALAAVGLFWIVARMG